MTSPTWPEIAARLRDTMARCDRDTDLELSAGPRGIRLLVRREVVRALCPGHDEARLAALGWHRPTGAENWWYEAPRTAQQVERLSVFVARTAAEVLTDRPGALSCRVVPPAERPATATPPVIPPAPATPPVQPTVTRPGPAEATVGGRLAAAVQRRDLPGYLAALADATVCVPLAGAPTADADFPWTVVGDATGAPLLPVFTSPDALAAFAGDGVPFVALPCADLLRDWPDPSWGLVVDPGGAQAFALAAPALATLRTANVDRHLPSGAQG